MCQVQTCNIQFTTYCSHPVCRKHAPCRKVFGGASYWDPTNCVHCLGSIQLVKSINPEVNKQALFETRHWVSGFSRNRQGPYLPSEEMRKLLFPTASKIHKAVVSLATSQQESVAGQEQLPQAKIVTLEYLWVSMLGL